MLIKCHATCTKDDVLRALGLTPVDLLLAAPAHAKPPRQIVKTYNYEDEAGALLYQVVRYEPKDFRPRRPDGQGGWQYSLGDVRRVLYRLPDLSEQQRVYFVEGEKDADNLAGLGIPSTTTQGGAQSWKEDYATQCAGLAIQEAIILPDRDEAGEHYATMIARALFNAGLRVKILRLPNVPLKGDVSDWIDGGGTHEALLALVDAAPWVEPFAAGMAGKETRSSTNGGPSSPSRPVLIRLSDVEAQPVTWLWKDRIAVGKIALVIGNPGGGKTYLTSGDVASRVTRGGTWPDGGNAPQGSVILLTSEDGVADTLRPRMDRLGGDPSLAYVLRGIKTDDDEAPFNLENDLPMLEQAIAETKAVLVIVDPLSAYLGSKDSYKDAEIRGILSPLAQLAERLHVAILSVLHLTKDQQRRLLLRAQGSIAFVAQSRTVLAVGDDPETEGRRLFVGVKNNLGQTAASLAFRITDNGISWEPAAVPGAPEELLAVDQSETRSERKERDTAATFLRDTLKDGPIGSKSIEADAKANGISQRTLWRAKTDLGICADRAVTMTGGKAAWYWRLPTPEEKAP